MTNTDPSRQLPTVPTPADPGRVSQFILDFVSQIPSSQVTPSAHPHARARELTRQATRRAALTAGSLALPPGPLGWLTVLPELVAIWRIQAQLVSDIAAVYGKQAELGREQMLWCLFRHTAAQAFRDLVVRMGDRLLFRRMSQAVAQRVAKRIGVRVSQRALGNGVSRWLPVIGAVGVGAYAHYDTGRVASTAIDMFSGDIEMATDDRHVPAPGSTRVVARRVFGQAADATRRLAARTAMRGDGTTAQSSSEPAGHTDSPAAAGKADDPAPPTSATD